MTTIAQGVTDLAYSTNHEGRIGGTVGSVVERLLKDTGVPDRIGTVRELTVRLELDRESGTKMMIVVHD